MAENQVSTEAGAAESKAAAEKQLANIVRGTIPRALVYLIRFQEPKDAKEADIAKKYGTTNGKVADILKNRNFAYIDGDFRPTQEDKDAAVKWLKQVPNYDDVGTDDAVNAVDALDAATDEDAKALADKRAAVRAKNAVASGEAKPEGGAKSGGSKGGKKGDKKEAEGKKQDATSLMT